MPKRNARPKKTLHLSELEHKLVKLQNLAREGGEHSKTAISMVGWLLKNQTWTFKQREYIDLILCKDEAAKICKKKAKTCKYYVYAITDGVKVKLGVTTSIPSRIKSLQTSCHATLSCVWKFYTGTCKKHAYEVEKKIHRACKKHKVRGEWFEVESLGIVREFKIERVLK